MSGRACKLLFLFFVASGSGGTGFAAASDCGVTADKPVSATPAQLAQALSFAPANTRDQNGMREPFLRIYLLMPPAERTLVFRQALREALADPKPIDVTFSYPAVLDLIRRDGLARSLWEKEGKGDPRSAPLQIALSRLPPPAFSLDGVIELLKRHPETVTAFLSSLPAQFRGGYALMYESQSSQPADGKSPRVIFYNEEVAIAFNGDPKKSRFETAEIMYLNPYSARVDLYEVSPVKGKARQVGLSEVDPQFCSQCHGHRNDPHANWMNYNFWRGAIGGHEDILGHDSPESRLVHDLVTKAKTDPRYHLLEGLATHFPEEKDVTRARNVFLGNALGLHNQTRLLRLFASSPNYCQYRYAILAALEGCKNLPGFIPAPLQAGWKPLDQLRADTKALGEKTGREFRKVYGNRGRSPTEFFEADKIAALRFLFENRGVSMEGWSTDSFIGYGWSTGISEIGGLVTLLQCSDRELYEHGRSDDQRAWLKQRSQAALGKLAPSAANGEARGTSTPLAH